MSQASRTVSFEVMLARVFFYQPTRVLLNKTPTRLREHNCLAKDGPLHSYGGCDGVVVSFLYSGVICVGVSVVYSRGVHRLFATCIYSLCGALTTRDGVRRLLPHVFIRSFTRYTWSNTCRLSPRVLTLSVERCPRWVRRFVCPCLCLLALLGGVCFGVRLCERIVYVLEHICLSHGSEYPRRYRARAYWAWLLWTRLRL